MTDALVAGLERGDRRALARLLTLVEDGPPARLREVIEALHARTGRARTIGITGPPGVGKSTLADALVTELRAAGRSVAVLAVDPSSPFTGGALLGDRVRMATHHADPDVFIRSMAARGHLGGLAVAAPHAVAVLDAAGFDDVLVETVGVGQSEVEVAALADATVVAVAPGMGDGVQAAKAGILEIADVLVITKADHHGAGQLESQLRGMLQVGRVVAESDGWTPPIVRTVAVRNEGVADLAATLAALGEQQQRTGERGRREFMRARGLVRALVLAELTGRVERLRDDGVSVLDHLATEVAARELDPYTAADRVVASLRGR